MSTSHITLILCLLGLVCSSLLRDGKLLALTYRENIIFWKIFPLNNWIWGSWFEKCWTQSSLVVSYELFQTRTISPLPSGGLTWGGQTPSREWWGNRNTTTSGETGDEMVNTKIFTLTGYQSKQEVPGQPGRCDETDREETSNICTWNTLD